MTHKYIVTGGVMEYMAHLHCLATSKEDALQKWQKAFPDCHSEVFLPEVVDVDERPDMLKHWKWDGYRYYAGAYRYDRVWR